MGTHDTVGVLEKIMAKDIESPAEDAKETPAIEAGEDKSNKPKTSKPMTIRHKAGCGAVGHSGACPVGPQAPIGAR